MSNPAPETAIREYLLRKLTLWIDNDGGLHTAATAAAMEAVTDESGTYSDADAHLTNYRTRPDEFYDGIGNNIADLIGEWVDEAKEASGDHVMVKVLDDILDLSDSTFRRMLGEHFAPDVDDVAEALGVSDEDDEDDEDDVPADYPVQPLRTDAEREAASVVATCGACGRSWDDGVSTSMTPAPAGRGPFEPHHA